MTGPAPRVIRAYHVLRSAHLERAVQMTPGIFVYEARRYDFDPALAARTQVRPGGVREVVRAVRAGATVVEVNEPLYRNGVFYALRVALAARFAGLLVRKRPAVVAYAIENFDWWRVPAGGTRERLLRPAQRASAKILLRLLSRIAFGTDAARELYRRRLPAVSGVRQQLFPALPAVCSCDANGYHEKSGVAFVSRLDARKGFDLLANSWPAVVTRSPAATLTIVGSGPMEPLAHDLADTAGVTLLVDPPREAIHDVLASAAIVVLLSQPMPDWREQVGLPIVEALAHGCSVVATDQTGLAAWLADHGHVVLEASATPSTVAASIAGAVDSYPGPEPVMKDLPHIDGRIAADRWLTDGLRA